MVQLRRTIELTLRDARSRLGLPSERVESPEDRTTRPPGPLFRATDI